MSCYQAWYFADGKGGVWALGAANPVGAVKKTQLTMTAAPGASPALAYAVIQDIGNPNQQWQFKILPSGQLQVSAVNVNVAVPKWIPAESPNGTVFFVQVNNGNLDAVRQPADSTNIPVPTVGTIYNPPDYLPVFTQPGGPGTQVLPAQPFGEMIALWAFSCGHMSNTLLVTSGTVLCVRTAIIQCPICSLAQRFIQPYEAIENSNIEAYNYLFP